jgi:hypothetical protein
VAILDSHSQQIISDQLTTAARRLGGSFIDSFLPQDSFVNNGQEVI